MHRRQLVVGRILHPQIQTLTLANIWTPVCRHIDDELHRYFPDCFVLVLEVLRNVEVLDRTVVLDDAVFDFLGPLVECQKVTLEVFVGHHEFAGEGAADINVARERLETFIVTEDLTRRCSGHGGDEERVSQTVGFDVFLE